MTTDTISAAAAATSNQAVSYWLGSDGDLDMSGMPASEALAELLAQCGSGEERATILAGRFQLEAGWRDESGALVLVLA